MNIEERLFDNLAKASFDLRAASLDSATKRKIGVQLTELKMQLAEAFAAQRSQTK